MRRFLSSLKPLLAAAFVSNAAYVKRKLAPLNLKSAGDSVSFGMSHSLVGAYEVGLGVENRIPMTLPRLRLEPTFKLKAAWVGGECLWELRGNYSPWWDDEKSGFTLVRFVVPDSIPLKTPVNFELTLVNPCDDFTSRYGESYVYCCKFSDK